MATPPSNPGMPNWMWNMATGKAGGGIFGGLGSGAKTWLFGGNATKGMASQPQTADYQRGYLQNDFMNRAAPTLNAAQSDQTRAQQGRLAGMLFQQATGQRPGAGEMAVNRQVNQGMAQLTSGAQMARGADAALAARNAARSGVDMRVNGAGMAAQAQQVDQANATQGLQSLLGGMRQQDIGTAAANQQAQMGQQQLQLSALAQMLGVDQAALQQDLAKRGLKMQDKGMFPTLLQTGGQIAASAVGGGAG